MLEGERQVAPDLSGIRRDHVARYEWAAKKLHEACGYELSPGDTSCWVVDLACGIGYGAKIMAEAGHEVVAVDRDGEAIRYGEEHYADPLVHRQTGDADEFALEAQALASRSFDAAVSFETIEHIEDPLPMLKGLASAAPVLLASVPNETVFPYGAGIKFHYRHYTADEFQALLNEAGWEVTEWWGQVGPESEVERDILGRTLIAVCRRHDAERGPLQVLPFKPVNEAPETVRLATAPKKPDGIGHVVIVGLGPSAEQYMDLVKRMGGRAPFADQVWAINALGDVLASDLVIHMDDIRVQELRSQAKPDSNIAAMVKWLRTTKTPVLTSRAHPSYPALFEFPLEEAINTLGYAYFNGTAAYACAYAILKGASKISFFGCDYTYPNAHHAEQGRACLEFWIGFAAARGIALGFAESTTLMDTICEPKDPNEIAVYGYDFDRVMIEVVDGAAKVRFEPRETTPTAADIEARYDHTRHPSPLLRG